MEEAVWKSDELAKLYLTGVRGAIPLAAEQIEIMVRMVEAPGHPLHRVLDLGSGDGVLAASREPAAEREGTRCDPPVRPAQPAARVRGLAEADSNAVRPGIDIPPERPLEEDRSVTNICTHPLCSS